MVIDKDIEFKNYTIWLLSFCGAFLGYNTHIMNTYQKGIVKAFGLGASLFIGYTVLSGFLYLALRIGYIFHAEKKFSLEDCPVLLFLFKNNTFFALIGIGLFILANLCTALL